MLKKTILFITGPSPILSDNKIQPKKRKKKAQRSISHAFTCHFSSSFYFLPLLLLLFLLRLLLEAAMSLLGYKRIHKGTTPFPVPTALTGVVSRILNIFLSSMHAHHHLSIPELLLNGNGRFVPPTGEICQKSLLSRNRTLLDIELYSILHQQNTQSKQWVDGTNYLTCIASNGSVQQKRMQRANWRMEMTHTSY